MTGTDPQRTIFPEQARTFRSHRLAEIDTIAASLDPTATDLEGNTALHLVCMPLSIRPESGQVIERILASGVRPCLVNSHGWSALMLAALLLPQDLFRPVLRSARESNATSNDSIHAAQLVAAAYERPDIVAAFLEEGASAPEADSAIRHRTRAEWVDGHRTLLRQIDTLLGLHPQFDREVAGRSDLDEQELRRMAKSTDDKTRQLVTLNPNTPWEVLRELAAEFPRAFYKNPVFDWMLLEDPDLLSKMKNGVLKHILTLADCPLSILRWAARSGTESEKLAVAKRARVDNETLAIIAANSNWKASAIAVARHPDSTDKEFWGALGIDPTADRLLALHRNASGEFLDRWSRTGDEIVRRNILNHPNVQAETVRKIKAGDVVVHRLK